MHSRGPNAPVIDINVANLLDGTKSIEVRAIKYLWLPLNHEETHFLLFKILRMMPELMKQGHEGMYDAIQELLAYVFTVEDMKEVTKYYKKQSAKYQKENAELDFTKTSAHTESLWKAAMGMSLETEIKLPDQNGDVKTVKMRAAILALLNDKADPVTSKALLKLLMGVIKEAQNRPDRLAAINLFVGKPIEKVMTSEKNPAVVLQIAGEESAKLWGESAKLWEEVIAERGEQNFFMADGNGDAKRPGSQKVSIAAIAKKYPGRTVVVMSTRIALVEELARKGKVFAMMFGDLISELEHARNRQAKKAKIGEILDALKYLAEGLDSKNLAQFQKAGGSGAGAAPAYPLVSAVIDSIRKSLFAEFFTARAA
jgi:hypothetical protein